MVLNYFIVLWSSLHSLCVLFSISQPQESEHRRVQKGILLFRSDQGKCQLLYGTNFSSHTYSGYHFVICVHWAAGACVIHFISWKVDTPLELKVVDDIICMMAGADYEVQEFKMLSFTLYLEICIFISLHWDNQKRKE